MTSAIESVVAELTAPPVTAPVDSEVDSELVRIVPPKFAIVDQASANWLVRRVLAAREYGQHVRAYAEQEQRRAAREEQTLLFLFSRQLEAWAKGVIEQQGGRRKSLAIPAGTLSFRRKNALLVVDDETAVIGWAKRNLPVAVETVERLSKTTINSYFAETGELPPFTHIEPAIERFSIS